MRTWLDELKLDIRCELPGLCAEQRARAFELQWVKDRCKLLSVAGIMEAKNTSWNVLKEWVLLRFKVVAKVNRGDRVENIVLR